MATADRPDAAHRSSALKWWVTPAVLSALNIAVVLIAVLLAALGTPVILWVLTAFTLGFRWFLSQRRLGREGHGDVQKRLKRTLAAVLLAGAALLALLPTLWAHSESGMEHCDSAFLGGDERTSPDVQPLGWSWWPPGMRCQVTPKGGQPQERVAPLF